MRKLCLAAGGFTFAIALCIWILSVKLIVPALVFSLLLFVILFSTLKISVKKENIRFYFRGICIFIAFAAIGFFRFGLLYSLTIAKANDLISKTEIITGICTEYPSSYTSSDALTVKLSSPASLTISLIGGKGSFSEVCPGDEISAKVKFYTASKINGEETDKYYSNGVFLKAVLKSDLTVLRPKYQTASFYLKTISKALKERALSIFPENTASFMKALLTGDKTELYQDEHLYYGLQAAGLLHIAAVSGMHVSFLVGAVTLILGKRKRSGLVSALFVLLFMAISGFTPSVTRAGIMQLFILLAPAFGAEPDMPTSMSASLFPILLNNPYALASISFLLSFGAMAGIIFITPRLQSVIFGDRTDKKSIGRSVYNYFSAALSAFLGAMSFTLPISIINFGFIPLYSLFTNLISIPILSAAFVLGYTTLFISLFSSAFAVSVGKLVGVLPLAVSKISKFTARLPLATIYAGSGAVSVWLIICGCILVGLIFSKKFNKPSPAKRAIIAGSIWIVSLVICLLVQFGGETETSFFAVDVGQGQSLALLSENGTVVIDCGSSSTGINAGDKAAAVLMKNGVYKLDALIFTHLHADHANGAERLLERIDTKNVIIPNNYEDSEWSEVILDACKAFDIKVTYVDRLYSLETDEFKLSLFPVCHNGDENERGLFIYGSINPFGSFLVTGDAGAETEKMFLEKYGGMDIDLLIVGHHGSNTSSSPELLDETTPETAVISVGYNNYGHPSDKVIQRLHERGIKVYRTDEKIGLKKDGTIKILFSNTE